MLCRWIPNISSIRTSASGGDSFLIRNARLEKCIHASSHEAEKVSLSECKPHSHYHQWSWDATTHAVVNLNTGQCLSVSHAEEFALAHLEACGGDGLHQAWVCSKKGHLTLQGLGLHLTTKPGGHKAFLSQEKDKFSRWKTLANKIVCATDPATINPGFGDLVEESLVPSVWVLENKTTALNKLHSFSVETTTALPDTIWGDLPNITSTLPKNEGTSFEEDQERYTHHKKHPRKAASSRHTGANWKTVMLVLSPLAFILGLVILLLNIHYNRKKKMLSALKSRQVRQEAYLSLPGTTTTSPKMQMAPASPSLKHGEILIEWKDGTITPLFDSMNYKIC
ncbi:uncharacterized protein LOC121924171 isoform X2 [Sceloporus undulatus]|uniref:uncharacterized protein LOC121924171 isoform X2 n=1 Tax=Sceloporus undulatus TaxID=8520 RepID=UPI001C4CDF7A|nr:uncharacterized protein LOC121924171 isoform X2 [Sceloporus undulatus]